jgi:D-amino-acid dehydrogenase
MRVAIIGGGVIGLGCAYELRKRGADVVVLEAGEMGAAASWGNAGWIVPSLSAPVPEPGLTLTALRWLLKPDSPLYIKPRLDPGFARWLWEFWRRCNRRDYQAGLRAVATLNARTMELYDAWREEGVEFEMHSAGLVFAFLEETYLRHALEDYSSLADYGYPQPETLSGQELRNAHPILSREVAGGFVVEPERHVEPGSLSRGLSEQLCALGADLRAGTRVTGFDRTNGHIDALSTENGRVKADAFLLAAGAWSSVLAGQAGFRLPVESGKGYSITVERPTITLERPLYLVEAKVAVTPFDHALRFAGTMELSGLSDRVDARRVASMRRSVGRFLSGWPAGEGESAWAGMRPLLPDGLPAVGRAPGLDNLFVATGHSMLGVTLAPTTATAIADLICGEGAGPASALQPFDPGRFSRHARKLS